MMFAVVFNLVKFDGPKHLRSKFRTMAVAVGNALQLYRSMTSKSDEIVEPFFADVSNSLYGVCEPVTK